MGLFKKKPRLLGRMTASEALSFIKDEKSIVESKPATIDGAVYMFTGMPTGEFLVRSNYGGLPGLIPVGDAITADRVPDGLLWTWRPLY